MIISMYITWLDGSEYPFYVLYQWFFISIIQCIMSWFPWKINELGTQLSGFYSHVIALLDVKCFFVQYIRSLITCPIIPSPCVNVILPHHTISISPCMNIDRPILDHLWHGQPNIRPSVSLGITYSWNLISNTNSSLQARHLAIISQTLIKPSIEYK